MKPTIYRSVSLVFCLLMVAAPGNSQDKQPAEAKKEPPPKVLYSVPLVVRAGEKQKIALRGKNLATVKEIKIAGAPEAKAQVLAAKAVPVPNNFPGDRVGDSEVALELDLPREVKSGNVKLVAIGPGGESNSYTVLVGDDVAAIVEKEPNDGFDQAQVIPLPVAVEATIQKERDADVFRFDGQKGDKLRIAVQAARFGSPVDAFVTVYDANRQIVASQDDADNQPDPALDLTLPRTGVYYVTVIDAHDLGGNNFGYRLVVQPAK